VMLNESCNIRLFSWVECNHVPKIRHLALELNRFLLSLTCGPPVRVQPRGAATPTISRVLVFIRHNILKALFLVSLYALCTSSQVPTEYQASRKLRCNSLRTHISLNPVMDRFGHVSFRLIDAQDTFECGVWRLHVPEQSSGYPQFIVFNSLSTSQSECRRYSYTLQPHARQLLKLAYRPREVFFLLMLHTCVTDSWTTRLYSSFPHSHPLPGRTRR
jgi:hypothetical protein